MKAKLVKDNLEGFSGHAALYELDEEIGYDEDWEVPGKFEGHTKYVVVSAAVAMFSGPETYIFPADQDGGMAAFDVGLPPEGVLGIADPVVEPSAADLGAEHDGVASAEGLLDGFTAVHAAGADLVERLDLLEEPFSHRRPRW